MSEPSAQLQTLPITWVSRVHTTWYDTTAQQSYEGMDLKFIWKPTGSLLEVKIPDATYTAANVYKAILAVGNQDNTVHGLAEQSG